MTVTREQLLLNKPLIIAGPCAVESREQLLAIAEELSTIGITVLRCQLWKPRSDKESFQGIGLTGIPWLKEVKEKYGFRIATEIVDAEHIESTKGVADILWVGARNMQNYELLKKLAHDDRVVILKRGFVATVSEWMSSAKYIGLDRVILCERGIRSGADSMRFTLDINTALVAQHDFHMPVIIDPSHTAGRADMVPYLAYSAMASGVDGIVIEVHNNPEQALSDKNQQITPQVFRDVYRKLQDVYALVHKS